ncbi:MAG: hypothetical protein ACHREM_09100 [Polyangiales bacterium]
MKTKFCCQGCDRAEARIDTVQAVVRILRLEARIRRLPDEPAVSASDALERMANTFESSLAPEHRQSREAIAVIAGTTSKIH